jgi:ribosomal protein S14
MYGTGLKAKATKLHAEKVRERGRCERCGKVDSTLQCAHIVGRRFTATRCDLANAWCLCAACHFLTGEHPDEFMALVEQTIGIDAYFELRRRAKDGQKGGDAWWQTQIDVLNGVAA